MTSCPPLRFILRVSLLLIPMLMLWGALLLDPLRVGLRLFTTAAFWLIPGEGSPEAAIRPNGDWSLRLPVPAVIGRQDGVQQMFPRSSRDDPAPIYVRSLTVVIEGKYPILFTAGLPFFWALLIAAGCTWRRGRALLQGSAALFIVAVASLIFFTLGSALKNIHLITGGAAGFLLDSGNYFVINVVPYVTPLVLALYLDSDLRTQVFFRHAESSHIEAAQPRKRRQRTALV
jgi:hypothetical protein